MLLSMESAGVSKKVLKELSRKPKDEVKKEFDALCKLMKY